MTRRCAETRRHEAYIAMHLGAAAAAHACRSCLMTRARAVAVARPKRQDATLTPAPSTRAIYAFSHTTPPAAVACKLPGGGPAGRTA